MTAYFIVSGVLFLFLAAIWGNGKAIDKLFKTALFGLTLWGLVLALQSLGYVVRP